jgi:hypothetical protein
MDHEETWLIGLLDTTHYSLLVRQELSSQFTKLSHLIEKRGITGRHLTTLPSLTAQRQRSQLKKGGGHLSTPNLRLRLQKRSPPLRPKIHIEAAQAPILVVSLSGQQMEVW